MNVFLCGYMGAGKSSIGKQLATLLNYSFIDSDQYIEDLQKMSISDIFASKGENQFREIEFQLLEDILEEENTVVALGGGSLEHHKLDRRIRSSAL